MSLTACLPETPALADVIKDACSHVAPLWPLDSFVAVNPFLGYIPQPFHEAAQMIDKIAHVSIYPDAQELINKLKSEEICDDDIRSAANLCQHTLPERNLKQWLISELQEGSNDSGRILMVSDWLDLNQGTQWKNLITDEISKWMSSYFDRGQSTWSIPGKETSLLKAWRDLAKLDANMEAAGVPGFRKLIQAVSELPLQSDVNIEWALDRLGITPDQAPAFLQRAFMSIPGWSSYAAYLDRMGCNPEALPQLLAIRLIYEVSLLSHAPSWRFSPEDHQPRHNQDLSNVALCALEHSYRTQLSKRLRTSRAPIRQGRPSLQIACCIDVRSEVLRRSIELQDPAVATIGFAGFFGMPIALNDSPRCPVLLSPSHNVAESVAKGATGSLMTSFQAGWKRLCQSSPGAFAGVEVGGLAHAYDLLCRSFSTNRKTKAMGKVLHWDISLHERISLAHGALRGMSLDPQQLAPIVVLCGHGSQSENNPYAAGLDCGACGGHAGDINAQVAVSILNDPAVRGGLRDMGILIPADTAFVAALHNTTTDQVDLIDCCAISQQQREWLEALLDKAGQAARRERNPELSAVNTEAELQRRSLDWSEVRPEWGLAGNAAFIAAPREFTSALNLSGRAFLHDYNEFADPDCSILNLILNAPVVVASWINLQYYASTVNNRFYGSGNKALHNVVGKFGVWEGNAGDLRTGLPLQSLHDGEKWIHEPLRLQVFIATTRERIDRVLAGSADVRNLVENHWIQLIAIEDGKTYLCLKKGKWTEIAN